MTMHLPHGDRRLLTLAAAVVAAITVTRILVLIFTPLQLYPDEAQYWWWAQSPDWGYFSKPPLIAWIIHATTVFGDPEWAIRLASPILHGCTALTIFGIGRLAYHGRVAFWSALAYATLPGVSYSSGLISTDVPLLLCWATALYAFLRSLQETGWRWPVVCGFAIGLGLLAKYAMLYFLLGAALSAVLIPRARHLILSARGLAIGVLAFGIFLPNLVWNAAHGFPTLAHTESNANWSHARYSLANAAAFLLSQAGVFGPLMMAGFVAALWRLARGTEAADSKILLAAYSVPVLLLMVCQAFASGANANWAAVAFVSATPLAVGILLRWWEARCLWLSLALSGAVMLALWMAALNPALAGRVGLENALKREQGWRELGTAVATQAERGRFAVIAAANRSILAELLYYARPRTAAIRAWDPTKVPRDHFQMTIPLAPGASHVLFVILPGEERTIGPIFDSFRRFRQVEIPLGTHRWRILELYEAYGYRNSPASP